MKNLNLNMEEWEVLEEEHLPKYRFLKFKSLYLDFIKKAKTDTEKLKAFDFALFLAKQ